MRHSYALLLLTACALASAACRTKEAGTETASRNTSDSGAEPARTERGEVAITTTSQEARTLYLRGRELFEQIRAHDARKLFEQAAAKDPAFALAHYGLAFTSPTPKQFLTHLDEAVRLSGKASEGERLMILALEANVNGDSKKSVELSEELVAKYPGDARAQAQL